MQVIEVNRKNLIVGSNNDIIDIIRERCGDELADLVSKKLSRGDSDEVYAKEALQTDLRSYESEIENDIDTFNLLQDQVNVLKEYVSGKYKNKELRGFIETISNTVDGAVQ